MALAQFEFCSSYNKIDHDIAGEFYLPCMRNSIRYDRITGYFASAIYVIAWDALKEFIANGGTIRIICSPFINEEDASALREGNKAKADEVIRKSLFLELEQMMECSYLEKPSKLLACLISQGIVTIKLAIPNDYTHPSIKQLFHDKVGVFYDNEGSSVGFRGSLNETYKGLSNSGNIESIDVFQSWDGGKEALRAAEAGAFFERIWMGQTPTVLAYDLPEEVKEKLSTISNRDNWQTLLNEVNAEIKAGENWLPSTQKGKKLRPHQFAALESWKDNGRRGIFEHATGSGKTFTAICAIRDALRRKQAVIVLVPSLGLLTQWEKELSSALSDLNLKILLCGTGYAVWKKSNVLKSWTSKQTEHNTIVLATMDTAAGDFFVSNVSQGDHLLLVADEVHRVGSERRRNILNLITGERLGLSATPIRYGDPMGTAALMDYFGGVVKPRYTLQNAIHDGVLTKYFYYPIEMRRKVEEHHASKRKIEELLKATEQIRKWISQRDAKEAELERLKIREAALLKSIAELTRTCWRGMLSERINQAISELTIAIGGLEKKKTTRFVADKFIEEMKAACANRKCPVCSQAVDDDLMQHLSEIIRISESKFSGLTEEEEEDLLALQAQVATLKRLMVNNRKQELAGYERETLTYRFYHRFQHSEWRHINPHQDILLRWFCQDFLHSQLLL